MAPRFSGFFGDVPKNTSGTITLTVQDAAHNPSNQFVNFVQINNCRKDVDLSNNQDTALTIVGDLANVWVLKDGTGVRDLGDPGYFEITWGNSGNITATNTTLSDVLPAGLTYTNVTDPNCGITGGGTLLCSFGDVAPGEGGTFRVEFTVNNDPNLIGTVITNLAVVATDTDETDLSDNQDPHEFPIEFLELASISGHVWHDDDRDVIMDIRRGRDSGSDCHPDRYGYFGNTVLLTTVTDSEGRYNFPGLNPGTYSVEEVQPAGWISTGESVGDVVSGDTPPALTPTGSLGPGPQSASNEGIIVIPLDGGERGIEYNFGEDNGSIGDTVWHDLNGDGIEDPNEPGIPGVTVELYLDSNMNGVLDGGDTPMGVKVTDSDGMYLFDGLPGGPGTNYFVVVSDLTGQLENYVFTSGSTPHPSNGVVYTETSPPIPLENGEDMLHADFGYVQPYLVIEKEDIPDPVRAGETLSYTIWVANPSVAVVSNVTVTETYDANFMFVSSVPAPTAGNNSWDLGDLGPGAMRKIVIDGVVSAGALPHSMLTNRAAAVASNAPPVDTEELTEIIDEPGDGETWVSITKTESVDPLPVGQVSELRYRIRIENHGTNDAYNLVVTEAYPADFSFVSATPAPTSSNNIWLINPLAAGSWTEIEVVGNLDLTVANAGDFRVNRTTVTSDNTPPSEDEEITGVEDLQNESPAPTIEKSDDIDWNIPGGTLTYTLVVRNPSQTAVCSNVVVEEDYSPWFTPNSASPAALDASLRSWNLGDLAPGAEVTITITGVLALDTPVSDIPDENFWIFNTAEVTSDGGSDSDHEETQVVLPAAVGDKVWLDADGDGVQDTGELGVPGVVVQLLGPTGEVIGVTTTDVSGEYLFDQLVPGDYQVVFNPATLPTGHVFSNPDLTLDDSDSDADPSDGSTPALTLDPGETNLTVDAGIHQPVQVGDLVWIDVDGDGVREAEDTNGVGGVTVVLLDNNGDAVATQMTDAAGSYLFTNLPPNNYSVRFDLGTIPPGSLVTIQDAPAGGSNNDSDADAGTGETAATPFLESGDTDLTLDMGLFFPAADIQIIKTVSEDGNCPGVERVRGKVGTPVTWCMLVSNAGNTRLDDVVVTDLDIGFSATIATLMPGATTNLSASGTIVSDLINTAAVTGVPVDPTGEPYPIPHPMDEDDAEVDLFRPAVQLVKTVSADGTCPGVDLLYGTNGTPLVYCFEISNLGDVALTNVVLNDAQLGLANVLVTNILASGAVITVSSLATLNGDLVNTATVTGEDPKGDPVEDTDDAEVDAMSPAIELLKTVSDNGSCPGQEQVLGVSGTPITYCFTVINRGDVPLTDVVIDDPQLGISGLFVTALLGTNQRASVSVPDSIQMDLLNTATATGDDPNGDPVTDDDTAEVDLIGPGIVLIKTVSDNGSCPGVEFLQGQNGAPVTYCFAVSNSGDVALTNVVLNDAQLGLFDVAVIGTLPVGATTTMTHVDTIDGDLLNVATVTGEDPNGDPVEDDDDAEVEEISPAIRLVKTVSKNGNCPGVDLLLSTNGTPLLYCFEVTNVGDVTLTNVVIDDAILGISGLPIASTLAVGQSATVSASSTLTNDLLNVATATGEAPNGDEVSDDDDAEVDEISPAIELLKTVSRDGNCPGVELVQGVFDSPVTYCFTVINRGDVPLTNVRIDDADIGLSGLFVTPLLGTGDSASVSAPSTIRMDLVNTATATGDDPNGDPVTDDDTAEVDLIGPGIMIEKTVSSDGNCPGVDFIQGVPGAAITYCFLVYNAGDVVLTNVVVNDAQLGLMNLPVASVLAVGQTVTVTSASTIQGDLVNVATATGEDPNGDKVEDEDDAEVDEVHPAIELEKTVSLDGTCPGTELQVGVSNTPVTYCFVVHNRGDVPLDRVVINDPALGVVDLPVAFQILPGESASAHADGVIDGNLTNVATATGEDPNGDPVSDDDDAEVKEIHPAIELRKTVSLDGSCPGTERVQGVFDTAVVYCFEVINQGDVPLTDVRIDDAQLGISSLFVTPRLGTGESARVSTPGRIRSDLVNIATATGDDPNGDPVSDDDTAEVDLIGPGITLEKTVSADGNCPGVERVQGLAGSSVTYCFNVINAGDVALRNVVINDPLLGITDLAVTSYLDVGASASVSAPGTINGDLVNTATATGDDPNGDPVEDEDTAEVDEIHPGIELQKTVSLDGTCPGSELQVGPRGTPVTYCFLVRNTGDVAIDDIVINDPLIPVVNLPVSFRLEPGESATAQVASTIDGDLVNTATATGDDPNGDPVEDEDTAEVDEIHPAIELLKTVSLDGNCPGSELVQGVFDTPVTYCFTVVNRGDVELRNVRIDDAQLGLANLFVTPLLGTGENASVIAPGNIRQDLVNTATATGDDPNGNPVDDEDTAEVDLIGPGITIEKTVSADGNCPGVEKLQAIAGTEVTYCFEVRNVGDVNLTDVVVNDPLLGITDLTVATSLAPGASATVSAPGTVQGDLINTATATGKDPNDDPVTDDDTAEVDEIAPAIELQKTVSADGQCPGVELLQGKNGDDITYCFEVKNTGDVLLEDVVINDAQLNIIDLFVAFELQPGASVSVSAPATINGDLTNTATVTSEDPNGDPVEDDDSAEVDEIAPAIELFKTVSLDGNCPGVERVQGVSGTPVTYCFMVVNRGDVPLTDVYINDSDLGITRLFVAEKLDPFTIMTVSAPSTITRDLVNTATVIGEDPTGETVEDDDTAEVDLIGPGIELQKTVSLDGSCPGAEKVSGQAGTPVTYCFEVTNTGDVDLKNVVISDPQLGLNNLPVIASLPIGGSASVSAPAAINGDLVNTAAVTGDDPNGDPVSDEDSAEVEETTPALDLQKTVSLHGICPGQEHVAGMLNAPLTYCFTAKNIGNVTLTNVVIDDAQIGVASLLLADILAPGESASISASGTLTGDLVNTATVTGEDPNGDPVEDDDEAEVEEIRPAIQLLKTVSLDGNCPGVNFVQGIANTPVTYCFTVINRGDVTLTDVRIDDADLGLSSLFVVPSLAPGDQASVSAASTLTRDLVNTATATGDDPNGEPVSDNDTAEVDLIGPGIMIEKTVSADGSCPGVELLQAQNGAAVTYCFRVSNVGDVPLTNVVINDPLLGLVDLPVTPLLVTGASVEVQSAATVNGDVVNTATVTGKDPNDDSVEDEDTAEVDEIAPALELQKTVSLNGNCPGAERVSGILNTPVTYCFEVKNIGDVTLTNVVVNDPQIGVNDLLISGILKPGESASGQATSQIDQDLVNTATVTGDGPDGEEVEDSDEAEVELIGPGIVLEKTVSLDENCPGVERVRGQNGTPLTYCFRVTNSGDVPLEDVVINDAQIGIVNLLVAFELAVGESIDVQAASSIEGDLVNVATVIGKDPNGDPVEDSDEAEVDEIVPAIELRKTVSLDGNCPGGEWVSGIAGTEVTFCFEVINRGDVALSDVVIHDAQLGIVGLEVTHSLPVGESITVQASSTIDGDRVNVAQVTAKDPNDDPVEDEDEAETRETDPAVHLEKTVSLDGNCPGVESVQGTSGTPITFCFRVVNIGDVTLRNLVINDPQLGITDLAVAASLAPHAEATISVPANIEQDLVNTATVTGEDPNGEPVEDDDTAEVNQIGPGLLLDKTVSTDGTCPGTEKVTAVAGTEITWCFKVTNVGDVNLTDVVLNDAELGLADVPVTFTLAVGESASVSAPGQVNGDTINTATATGKDPNDAEVSDDDSAEVNEVLPGIEVQKTVTRDGTCPGVEKVKAPAGTSVTFCFQITNTGDVDLSNIKLNDPLLGISDMSIQNLSVGESTTLTAAGIIEGSLINTAHVTGTPVDEEGNEVSNAEPVEDEDTAEVEEELPASIGDRVWEDLNGDGVQDEGEPGLPGVRVELVDGSGVLADTTTDENGHYEFTGLRPGTYRIRVVPPAGYRITEADAGSDDERDSDIDEISGVAPDTELTEGENDPSWDAGLYRPVSVGDRVWLDLNADGVQDDDETTGVSGVTVTLLNAVGDAAGTTTTDADGRYRFEGLPPGDYAVRFAMREGLHISPPHAAPDASDSDVDPATRESDSTGFLTSGSEFPDLDLGLYNETASIEGQVRADSDMDGALDDVDPPISNIVVDLYLDANGNGSPDPEEHVAQQRTTGNGSYLFTGLEPGSYIIVETDEDGSSSTGDIDGGDFNLIFVELSANEASIGNDFLDSLPGSIGDTVWQDLANDQSHEGDPLETVGIPGVTIRLYQVDGASETLIDTRITDHLGQYLFESVPVGQYRVDIDTSGVPSDLHVNTTPLSYDIEMLSGLAVRDADFGFMGEPTAVSLIEFNAIATESGIVLRWRTGSETDNLGFNLYRSTTADGDRVKVNAQLIRGANRVSGAEYQAQDVAGQPGDFYWLEDVAFNMETSLHGPFAVDGEDAVGELQLYFADGATASQGIFGSDGQIVSHPAFGGLLFLSATDQVEIRETTAPKRMQVIDAAPQSELATEIVAARNGQARLEATADSNLLVDGVADRVIVFDLGSPEPVVVQAKTLQTDAGKAIYLKVQAGAIIRVESIQP